MKRHPAIKAISFTPDPASMASVGNRHANNEFIGGCIEFDELLAKLSDMRRRHFGVDPEAQRTWGDVGIVTAANRKLRDAVAFLTPAAKPAS